MDNGNIPRKLIGSNIDGTIHDDILFYYDTTWPDRLVEYNSKRIDYDTDSIGCPHHMVEKLSFGLLSNETLHSAFSSCVDVDMENSKEWLEKIWERIKELFS